MATASTVAAAKAAKAPVPSPSPPPLHTNTDSVPTPVPLPPIAAAAAVLASNVSTTSPNAHNAGHDEAGAVGVDAALVVACLLVCVACVLVGAAGQACKKGRRAKKKPAVRSKRTSRHRARARARGTAYTGLGGGGASMHAGPPEDQHSSAMAGINAAIARSRQTRHDHGIAIADVDDNRPFFDVSSGRGVLASVGDQLPVAAQLDVLASSMVQPGAADYTRPAAPKPAWSSDTSDSGHCSDRHASPVLHTHTTGDGHRADGGDRDDHAMRMVMVNPVFDPAADRGQSTVLCAPAGRLRVAPQLASSLARPRGRASGSDTLHDGVFGTSFKPGLGLFHAFDKTITAGHDTDALLVDDVWYSAAGTGLKGRNGGGRTAPAPERGDARPLPSYAQYLDKHKCTTFHPPRRRILRPRRLCLNTQRDVPSNTSATRTTRSSTTPTESARRTPRA